MTEKELIEKLIAHYEYGLSIINPKVSVEINILELVKIHLNLGVCYCAFKEFGLYDIYGVPWIVQNCYRQSGYWTTIPDECYYFDDIKDSLEFRLKILKQRLLCY